jgi:hypothetical protein
MQAWHMVRPHALTFMQPLVEQVWPAQWLPPETTFLSHRSVAQATVLSCVSPIALAKKIMTTTAAASITSLPSKTDEPFLSCMMIVGGGGGEAGVVGSLDKAGALALPHLPQNISLSLNRVPQFEQNMHNLFSIIAFIYLQFLKIGIVSLIAF